MKSMRSSTMSAPPATASLISSSASATVGAITLVVRAHESPLKCAWGSARVLTPPPRVIHRPRRSVPFVRISALNLGG